MAANPNRRITVKWATSHYVLGSIDGIRIRIEVECSADVGGGKIFAYRMLPKDPATGEKEGFFSHVCSPVDLEEYPADAPVPTHVPEWFRLSYVDVLVRSWTEAEAFINDVISDVRRLKTTLDAMDTVAPTGAEDVGAGTCPESSSSSSSSSASAPSSSVSLGAGVRIATGTFENQSGFGMPWSQIGTGAGSPVGSSDSLGANYQRVFLPLNQVSKTLLVQGFPFDTLPDDAIIDGLIARLVLRKYGLPGGTSSSSSSSSSTGTPNGARLFFFRLHDPDNGWIGDNQANNDVIVGPEWNTLSFGAVDNTWGAALTPALLKRGGFGVGLVVGNTHDYKDCTVDIDGIELEVHFRG